MIIIFRLFLIGCAIYACAFGGKTGRIGSAIFIVATVFSYFAAWSKANWIGPNVALFYVDAACMIALGMLAINSNRYWPIWALGFQIIAVTVHVCVIVSPDIVPRAYRALLSVWSIFILSVMVAGTILDRREEMHSLH